MATSISRSPSTGNAPDADHDHLQALGRVGFASRAVVHVMMGLLALRLAFGKGSGDASARGAIEALAQQPFGQALVGITAIGLAAYSLWRLAMTFLGSPDSDTVPDLVVRGGWFASALFNGALGFLAAATALGSGGSSSGGSGGSMTRAVLDNPVGMAAVVAVGLVLIGTGLREAKQGWTEEFADDLDRDFGSHRRTAVIIGRIGHVGRGLAFVITGGFVVRAAVSHDSSSATGGLDAALREVQQSSFGTPVLLAVAVGILAYGLWCGAVTLWGQPAE